MRNKVKEKLTKGEAALGVWMSILNEKSIAAVANSDLDWVLEACKGSKVAPGIAFGKSPAHCGELIEQGYRFIAVGSDTGFIRAGVNANLSQLKR